MARDLTMLVVHSGYIFRLEDHNVLPGVMAGIEELAESRGGVAWDQLVHLLSLVQNRAERGRHVLDGITRRLRIELLSDEGANLGWFDLGERELSEHGQEVVIEDLAVVVLRARLAVRRDDLCEPVDLAVP